MPSLVFEYFGSHTLNLLVNTHVRWAKLRQSAGDIIGHKYGGCHTAYFVQSALWLELSVAKQNVVLTNHNLDPVHFPTFLEAGPDQSVNKVMGSLGRFSVGKTKWKIVEVLARNTSFNA